MTGLLWFLLGVWIGGSAGFLLFAWVQMGRDSERAVDRAWFRFARHPEGERLYNER